MSPVSIAILSFSMTADSFAAALARAASDVLSGTMLRHLLTFGRLSVYLAFALIAAVPTGSNAQTFDVRGTIYDRLDLVSPESALCTFLVAFRNGDFVTAYWVFSRQAQQDWYNAVQAFDFNAALGLPGSYRIATAQLNEYFPPLDKWEHNAPAFLFAHMLNRAKREGLTPLNLTGLPPDLTLTKLQPLIKRGPETPQIVDLTVELPAQPLVFRMEKSPLGKWRVGQIIFPGGDQQMRPWSLLRR